MSKKNRQQSNAANPLTDSGSSRFGDYFWANIIFMAFLALLSFVVWQSCQAPTDDAAVKMILGDTFKFMIFLFGGGFMVVTLFDAAYEFFADHAEIDDVKHGQ